MYQKVLLILFLLLAAFRKTKDVFGDIDIVINNAGIAGIGLGNPQWKKVIDIDLVGFSCAHEVPLKHNYNPYSALIYVLHLYYIKHL